jgi:ParB/RepB/Spo0J family partition protein
MNTEECVSRDTIYQIPVSEIDPNPDQPRKSFYRIDELAESIRVHGIQNPVVVESSGDGRYTLISGERRTRAAVSIGLETIPAIICNGGDRAILALVENVQRDDLSPLDEARAYQSILNRGMTQEDLSNLIGKDRSYIAQKIRLLAFSGTSIESAMITGLKGSLSEGAARQLLRLKVLDDIATKKDPVYETWLRYYSNKIVWRPNYARSVREVSDLVDEYLTAVYLFKNEKILSDDEVSNFIDRILKKRESDKHWWKIGFSDMAGLMRHNIMPDYSRLSDKQESELIATMERWFNNHVYDENGA